MIRPRLHRIVRLQTMSKTVRDIEQEILGRLRELAVRQTFLGTLVVDPSKIVVSKADGERAILALKRLLQPNAPN